MTVVWNQDECLIRGFMRVNNRVYANKFCCLIIFSLLTYMRKGQNFWPLKATKAARPKKAKTFQKISMAQNA